MPRPLHLHNPTAQPLRCAHASSPKTLQQAGDLARAKECYERAATGQERQRSGWHAAKNLEKAAEAARDMGAWQEVEDHYARAAELFAEEGRPTAAAEAAARGARALEERRPEVRAPRGGARRAHLPLHICRSLRPSSCLPCLVHICMPPAGPFLADRPRSSCAIERWSA